jgi:hypothetical protein
MANEFIGPDDWFKQLDMARRGARVDVRPPAKYLIRSYSVPEPYVPPASEWPAVLTRADRIYLWALGIGTD